MSTSVKLHPNQAVGSFMNAKGKTLVSKGLSFCTLNGAAANTEP